MSKQTLKKPNWIWIIFLFYMPIVTFGPTFVFPAVAEYTSGSVGRIVTPSGLVQIPEEQRLVHQKYSLLMLQFMAMMGIGIISLGASWLDMSRKICAMGLPLTQEEELSKMNDLFCVLAFVEGISLLLFAGMVTFSLALQTYNVGV